MGALTRMGLARNGETGFWQDLRELLHLNRRVLEGSLPCSHTWEKIGEIEGEPVGDQRRIRFVLMCPGCGATRSEDFGPPERLECPHKWEIHEELEDWFQPTRYVGNRRYDPVGKQVMRSKVYVNRCTECGDLKNARVKVHPE